MEVTAVRNDDFVLNGASSSPYLSASSSPERINGYFLSAPASPSGLSEFYNEFENMYPMSSASSIPFDCEDRPSMSKLSRANTNNHDHNEDDFSFSVTVSEERDNSYRSAEELFDGGKIKPLKPQTQVQLDKIRGQALSTKFSSAQGRKMIRDVSSSRRKQEDAPLTNASNGTRNKAEFERGRDRTPAAISSFGSGRRATRSHSPYRVSDNTWEEGKRNAKLDSTLDHKGSPSSSTTSKSSRRWRFMDLFLFRSASEGRPIDKDPFSKYSIRYKKVEDDKNSNSRRKAPVPPHELHYAINKATSEESKRKTYLPYKHGILGRLAFNPKFPFKK